MVKKEFLAYGFMAFPLAAAFIALQVIVPTHYAELTNLSLASIGVIMVVARLWDTITDPVVGYLSDATPQRCGRRRIWILASMPLIAISVIALFNPSPQTHSTYLLLCTLAIYASGTMAIVPMNAWGAELSSDYHERNHITGVRAVFGLLGTLLAIAIPAFVGETDADDYSHTLFLVTCLVVSTLLISGILLLFVRDNHAIELPASQWKAAINLVKQPTPYRLLLSSFFCNSIANAIPATLFLFYVDHVLNARSLVGPLLFTYFFCCVLSIPVWVVIAKNIGKETSWRFSMAVASVFFIGTAFLGQDTLWAYWIIVIVTGFCAGCDVMIPSSMNGDLIEWDKANNGYRRPGLFFALWGTTTKLAFAVAIGLAFPLLQVFGFSAGTDNTDSAVFALALIYGVPTVVFKCLAMYLINRYPVTEKQYREYLSQAK